MNERATIAEIENEIIEEFSLFDLQQMLENRSGHAAFLLYEYLDLSEQTFIGNIFRIHRDLHRFLLFNFLSKSRQ